MDPSIRKPALPMMLVLALLAGLAVACNSGSSPAALTPTPAGNTPAALSASPQTAAITPTPLPTLAPTPPPPTSYVVESGDYPILIAEKLGVPEAQQDAWIEEMLALNGMEATALQIGLELILPPFEGATTAQGPAPGETPASNPETQPTTAPEGQPGATNTPGSGAAPTATSAPGAPTPTSAPAEATATTAAAAATTVAPTPAAGSGSFGDGILAVGTDIAPGTYRTRTPSSDCYWARLSSLDGETIAYVVDSGYSVATIQSDDVGFESDGCAAWSSDLSPVTSSTTAPFTDGTYIVGVDIAAGTWQANAPGEFCYWERLSGFSANLGEIIENNSGVTTVTIAPSDAGFYTGDCGTWTRIQ